MKEKKRPLLDDITLSRESWKVFQIMAEFVDGFEHLSHIKPCVSIFGSARMLPEHPFYHLTEAIAYTLSEAGFSVVSGGGPGLMEAANKGAYQGPSLSVGLNVANLMHEKANSYQDVSLYFRHFFSRKAMFIKYASAYIVMPGGFGTLDEFAEILTLIQTGKSRKIPIILVSKVFWQGLISWFHDTLLTQDMVREKDLELFKLVDTREEVLQVIFKYYSGRGFEPSEEEKAILANL